MKSKEVSNALLRQRIESGNFDVPGSSVHLIDDNRSVVDMGMKSKKKR